MIKTYVLLDVLDSTAPIFQTLPNNQRSQIKKMPFYRPYLDLPVQDEKGKSKRLRLKYTSEFLFADEQFKENNIPANEKFTDEEYGDPTFRNGSLTTNNLRLQQHLEINPAYDKSTYTSTYVKRKEYTLLDLESAQKSKNSDFKKRLAASNKIDKLDLEEAQQMIIRLNGFSVETPKTVEECQNWLIAFLDDAEDEGIEAIMKEDKAITTDEKTAILIGELVNNKLLEFAADNYSINKPGKDGKKIEIRNIVADTLQERERLFGNFLDTSDGKALREDLEKDLAAFKTKNKQDSKPKT